MGLLEHPIKVSSQSSQGSFVRLRGFEFRLKFCSIDFMSSSSQSSRFRSPHDNFYPPPACSSGLTWLYVLHWCGWTAVHLMNVIILFCHMDEMSMRSIQKGFLGREVEDGCVLASLVCGDGAHASALCLSGPLFSAHSSTFFDLDDVFILSRVFIWIFWVEIWFESASSCGASSSRHQAIQRLQGWSKRW